MKRDTIIDEVLARAQNENNNDYEQGVAPDAYRYNSDEPSGNPPSQDQDEPVDQEHKPRKRSKISEAIGSVLSGSILSHAEVKRQYPYMLFLAFLTLIYIANVFKMQQLHRQHGSLTKEVKELRAKSLTISSHRVDATRQSQIIKELEARGLGLQESLTPPKVISK